MAFDEARSWLQILNAISNIPYLIWWFMVRAAPWFLYAVVFMVFVLIAVDDADPDRHMSDFFYFVEWATNFVWYAPIATATLFLLLPILTAAMSILIRSSGIAFGYEGIFGHSLLNITASAIPQVYDPAAVTLVRAKPSSSGLRHSSFYLDPSVAALINKWMVHESIATSVNRKASYRKTL